LRQFNCPRLQTFLSPSLFKKRLFIS